MRSSRINPHRPSYLVSWCLACDQPTDDRPDRGIENDDLPENEDDLHGQGRVRDCHEQRNSNNPESRHRATDCLPRELDLLHWYSRTTPGGVSASVVNSGSPCHPQNGQRTPSERNVSRGIKRSHWGQVRPAMKGILPERQEGNKLPCRRNAVRRRSEFGGVERFGVGSRR